MDSRRGRRLTAVAIALMALSSLCRTVTADAAQASLQLVYPDGPFANKTIEYKSRFRGGSVVGQVGLNDSHDQAWDQSFEQLDLDFDPNVPDVGRWLPPLESDRFEVRMLRGTMDITNVIRRNGTWPDTNLRANDAFWSSACRLVSSELSRLRASSNNASDRGRMMEVLLKHYGVSLGRRLVWTYIHLVVINEGTDMLAAFGPGCPQWLAQLTLDTEMPRTEARPDNATTRAPGTIYIPPKDMLATYGGMKAVQTSDGSKFTIWILPTYEF